MGQVKRHSAAMGGSRRGSYAQSSETNFLEATRAHIHKGANNSPKFG